MDRRAAQQLLSDLYRFALNRKPGVTEYADWIESATTKMNAEDVVRAFYNSAEFQAKRQVNSVFEPGHYHSPVVDPRTVSNYVTRERMTEPDLIAGIPLDTAAMRRLWLENLAFIQQTPFSDDPFGDNRYSYLGGPFPWGDAVILRMMIGHFRPKRVIEVGSGYSSACMLDASEHAGLSDFNLTCIEPYPERLKSLLRAYDAPRVTIIEKLVQDVPVDLVDTLDAGDFLFIDSTHVMKTGSDVHHEFFHMLPRVKPGVIIQVHDVIYPFEYPDEWIFDSNYSWNEAYALRAFLMYNSQFRVIFWNSLFGKSFTQQINAEFPLFMKNPGGSIWLERV